MKLIIDVPDNVYAKVMEYYEHNGIVEAVYGYIYRGIPLEQISDEIDQKQYDFMSDGDYNEGIRFGLMLAYQIIDKYRCGRKVEK